MIKITFLRDVKARFGITKRLHTFHEGRSIMVGSVSISAKNTARLLSFIYEDVKYIAMTRSGEVIITIP